MKKKLYILILSIAINCITVPIVVYFSFKKINQIKSVDKISSRTINKSGVHSILNIDSRSIVMLGNSITERMPWAELLNDLNIKNRGIGGDKTEGILFRLKDITEGKPKKIFLMIGINDLIARRDPDMIMINYIKIIETIQSESSDTRIIIQSVLPNNKSFEHFVQSSEINKLNKLISEYALKNNIDYINLHDSFADKNSEMMDNLVTDGLHINEKGYLLWKDLIIDKIYE